MTSPARRVLGSKNPNAPLQQQSTKGSDPASQLASPATHTLSAKQPPSPANTVITSPRIGQKRKIEAVDNTEQAEPQELVSAHHLSQVTDVLSDVESDDEEADAPVLTHSKSTLNTTFSSFQDSQEESARVEPEFHIHEEPSQQALDTMVRSSSRERTAADNAFSMPSHLLKTPRSCFHHYVQL